MTSQSAQQNPAIHITGESPVLTFAAHELQSYLQKITGCILPILTEPKYDAQKGGIWLGEWKDIPQEQGETPGDEFSDAIRVNVQDGQGHISGVNGRSVLLAVYRFLTEVGCRWVRPGREGEVIPKRRLESLSVTLDEKPSYRHRVICIEGAVSIENVLDLIDWSVKVGFSGYFMQFRTGHTFFDRWYAHDGNPTLPGEHISAGRAREFTHQIQLHLAQRGMLFHAVGHGWTCEAYGIPGLGWNPVKEDWSAEVLNSLALVNGKRAMWQDIPLVTSLCFSQAEVRRKVVNCVVEYVLANPGIAALHLWLDDGWNNKCECPECSKLRPSDYYVRLLNELDQALTEIHYPGKIVFLAYADLLWAPQVESFAHPERFILMFAPITRSYRHPLAATQPEGTLPPYVRNKLVFTNNNQEQLGFLREWQTLFQGDSFIFDYHLWRPGGYTCDPDGLFLAELVSQDVKNLKDLGLDGYVSCQIQRFFFPTGLPMYVLGKTLWDSSLSYQDLHEEYFSASFGQDWKLASAYLGTLSTLQDVVPVLEKDVQVDPDAQTKLQHGMDTIRGFLPTIDQHLALEDLCQARSWFYLKVHADLMQRYLALLDARAGGKTEEVRARWQEIKAFLAEQEVQIQPAFDLFVYKDMFDRFFA